VIEGGERGVARLWFECCRGRGRVFKSGPLPRRVDVGLASARRQNRVRQYRHRGGRGSATSSAAAAVVLGSRAECRWQPGNVGQPRSRGARQLQEHKIIYARVTATGWAGPPRQSGRWRVLRNRGLRPASRGADPEVGTARFEINRSVLRPGDFEDQGSLPNHRDSGVLAEHRSAQPAAPDSSKQTWVGTDRKPR